MLLGTSRYVQLFISKWNSCVPPTALPLQLPTSLSLGIGSKQ